MSEDPRIEAVARSIFGFSDENWTLAECRSIAIVALAAADAAAWRPVSEAGGHEQIIAYRCSWGSVVVGEGYPLKDGEWVIPGSAATVEPIACQPYPTPPQEQDT